MPEKKRVYVYKEGLGYRVYPPVVILKKNDSMTLVNLSDKDAQWDVPEKVLQDKPVSEHVPKGKSSGEIEVQNDGLRVSHYTVTLGILHAHGNSDPVIIID